LQNTKAGTKRVLTIVIFGLVRCLFFLLCSRCTHKILLALVTRNWIPDSIYESWNTQPVIAGSDSERDDCNDILLSDTDDSVSIKSDNDLASSLMELDMSSDSDVKDPKGKGKAKAAPARTPVRSQNGEYYL
jgi:hypothetical protein